MLRYRQKSSVQLVSSHKVALNSHRGQTGKSGILHLNVCMLQCHGSMNNASAECPEPDSILSQETEANLDSFTYHFASIQQPADKVIIDCTASAAVPCFYTK